MPLRREFLCLLPAIAITFAGDGVPHRGSAEDYPAHQTAGKVAIGAAYIPPAQIRKLFGEDLDKHGYVVFEVGVFPIDSKQADVSADDFELMQGQDTRPQLPRHQGFGVSPRGTPEERAERFGFSFGRDRAGVAAGATGGLRLGSTGAGSGTFRGTAAGGSGGFGGGFVCGGFNCFGFFGFGLKIGLVR